MTAALKFRVVDARPEKHAAVPTLMLDLVVTETSGARVESVSLRCQLRIEPQRRKYTPDEEQRLVELFGETPRWGDTLKPFLWTHVTTVVPGFTGETRVTLHVECSYDLEVAAAKYFHALGDEGEVPLVLLFNGSVFVAGPSGLQISQVAWDRDANFRLPARVWRETMDLYYPASGWLRLRRDTLDELGRWKAERALATYDEAIVALLKERQS